MFGLFNLQIYKKGGSSDKQKHSFLACHCLTASYIRAINIRKIPDAVARPGLLYVSGCAYFLSTFTVVPSALRMM